MKAVTRYLLLLPVVLMTWILSGCGYADWPATPPPTASGQPAAASPFVSPLTEKLAPDATPVSTSTVAAPTPVISGSAVRIRDVVLPVELAIDPADRRQGLSDRLSLDPGAGMLFVFEEQQTMRFWMKNMQFPLDIVWFDSDCRLVGVSRDVPVPMPDTDDSDLPRYGLEREVQFVLEINAGEAVALGLEVGDTVEFLAPIGEEYGC